MSMAVTACRLQAQANLDLNPSPAILTVASSKFLTQQREAFEMQILRERQRDWLSWFLAMSPALSLTKPS